MFAIGSAARTTPIRWPLSCSIGATPVDGLWLYSQGARVKVAPRPLRDCHFVGSSRKDLAGFPNHVRIEFGHALYEVQLGFEPYSAKALKGFGGRGILELIENHDGDTYRAVYTVRFEGSVYVLHCFQKKSVKGVATPEKDIDLIKSRLQLAEADVAARRGGRTS